MTVPARKYQIGVICPTDFIKRLPFGGASGLIENIMAKVKVPCTIFGIGVNGTPPWQPLELFSEVTFIAIDDFSYPARIPLRFSTLFSYWKAKRRILESGVNLLYIHSPEVALPFLYGNRHIPVIYHQHGSGNPIRRAKYLWARSAILEKIFDAMLWLIHRRSAWTIAIDSECYAQAEKNGIAHKTNLLMNCVDTEKFLPDPEARQALRKQYDIQENTCLILFAGRLEQVKRVDRAISAMKVLGNEPGRYHLFIAGDGTLRRSLEEQAEREEVSNMVTFLGLVPPQGLPGCYNMADILVLPSEMEGTPMVILEALACGTPVVASNVGGIPVLIQNMSNGIVVDQMGPDTLAKAIQRINRTPPQREAVSLSVRRLSADSFLYKLLEIFKNVMDQREEGN